MTVLTDNQSVVHSLIWKETSNKTLAELKSELNRKCRSQNLQIRIKWIKAHVGHPGNEYADELAKRVTEMRPFGPLPLTFAKVRTLLNYIRTLLTWLSEPLLGTITEKDTLRSLWALVLKCAGSATRSLKHPLT